MQILKQIPPIANNGELTSIDTEFFRHPKPLHRPGGKFACLTVALERDPDTVYLLRDREDVRASLKNISNGQLVLQNALYDIRQLRHIGLWEGRPKIWDTMLVELDLFGGWFTLVGLDDLVRRWLFEKLPKEVRNQFVDADDMTPEMEEYAAADSRATLRVAQAQMRYVEKELGNDFGWYWDIDEPALWAVLDMAPIQVDVDGWIKFADELEQKGLALQERLGFNVKSPKQTLKALGLKKGTSTGADNLERWLEDANFVGNAEQSELLQNILEARKYRDAPSKYGRRWVEEHVEKDGYVYADWRVVGAPTGRMACSHPNLQQIPIREMPTYRTFFLASPGNSMLVSDVKQQEPCCSAALSGDEELTRELLEGIDLHEVTRKQFGVQTRDLGKAINLGLNYGMSAYGLSMIARMPVEQAEDGLRARRQHYHRMTAWQERMVRRAEKLGYINTLSGRPMWVNPYDNQHERHAINSPVQGSAGDQTKLALGYVHQQCESEGLPFKTNLVVHDEIDGDYPDGLLDVYRRIVTDAWHEAGKKLMPTIPTTIEIFVGPTWGVKK